MYFQKYYPFLEQNYTFIILTMVIAIIIGIILGYLSTKRHQKKIKEMTFAINKLNDNEISTTEAFKNLKLTNSTNDINKKENK